MTDALQFAIELSQSTGSLLLRYDQRSVSIQLKADHSPITEAELAADAWIAAYQIAPPFPLQSGVDYRTRHFATLAARSPQLAQ